MDGVQALQGAGLTSWMTNPGARGQGASDWDTSCRVHDDVRGTRCARMKTVPWQCVETLGHDHVLG